MPRLRGARPSPRHRLAAARPHQIFGITSAQVIWLPRKLSFWGNQVDGDCCTAEEACQKGTGTSGVFIPDDVVIAWATKNGVLNGAELTQVIDDMMQSGFTVNGTTYGDGEPSAVDWTNEDILQNAISQGPVKLGVAADQLEGTVPDPPTNGWYATGYSSDNNLDHCTGLQGFGPVGWLASQIQCSSPSSVDMSTELYAMFTWNSIGFIDFASLQAICGEAWLRNPTTVVVNG